MGFKLGVVMDPIENIQFHKDSTLSIMLAAQAQGDPLYYIPAHQLSAENGQAYAGMYEVKVFDNESKWFELGPFVKQPLASLDAVLMRKDPPFDMNYIYATYILELAEHAGVKVFNRPQSLRDCNEKFFTTWFSDHTPETLVSADTSDILKFINTHKDCILKPLDGMGGASIFRVKQADQNTNVITETLTHHNQTPCMVQQYIPEITDGDKRILIFNGVALDHMVVRMPSGDDFRGNLAAGASAKIIPLGDQEKKLAQAVGPTLVEKGLYMVGLDVIGRYITEINVTSPTCLRHIDLSGLEQAGDKCVNMIHTVLNQK